MVIFEERNLAEDDPVLWQPDGFDIIFCRNVIMYFTPSQAQALIARLVRALAPGGFLFLGSAETLRGLSQEFHLRHTHGTFYYQRKSATEQTRTEIAPTPRMEDPLPFGRPPGCRSGDVRLVGRSDRNRLEAYSEARATRVRFRGPGLVTAGTPPAGLPWNLNLALDLLRKERFAEALECVSALPPESTQDPDVLLLRAVLQTHGGQLAEARKSCSDLLALDELNAGAQYLLALCCEEAGDRQGAIDHDQASAYLDPGFAMPHLHAGLLARRSGDREAARRELGQALVLLRREEASKVLLFGGGFSREGLLELCRAQLVSSGGVP